MLKAVNIESKLPNNIPLNEKLEYLTNHLKKVQGLGGAKAPYLSCRSKNVDHYIIDKINQTI